MPELDGIQTLHMLRADQSSPNQDTKVIALTANAIAGCREMYLEYGFDDYISKPIQAVRLEQLLMEQLPESLVHKAGEIGQAPDSTTSPKASQNAGDALAGQKLAAEGTMVGTRAAAQQKVPSELLFINHELGLTYCGDMEEIYQDALAAFCDQSKEYLPLLESYFAERNWEQYAIIAHALKGNTLNIGAANFSKLSLQHELAGKERNEQFILAEYANYIAALKKLVEKVEGEL